MRITKQDIGELKILQPELTIIGSTISGCFYVSASLDKKSRGRGVKLACYPWSFQESNHPKRVNDHFYIDVRLDEKLYPIRVFETSGKLLSWKGHILSEYWHVNSDNSLCLGLEIDIKQKQQNSSSFANFINEILTEYFYYICYVKEFGHEPWEAYRHGLFAALEKANEGVDENCKCIVDILTSDDEIWGAKKEWGVLVNKTKGSKIKYKSNCPFCQKIMLVRNCNFHKKQIKGYNKIIQYLSTFPSNQ